MKLTGRDGELERVVGHAVSALDAGRGTCILLEGPAGIGKTTLLEAALSELHARRPAVRVGVGQCRDDVASSIDPCPAFTSALRDVAGTGRGGLRELLAELAPTWLSVVPLVGGLLSAIVATVARLRRRDPPALSGERLVRRYNEAVRKLAAEHPLVLALEDLQLADAASAALFGHLCRAAADLPVVVIASRRSNPGAWGRGPLDEVIPELERERLAERLSLRELPVAHVRALVRAELDGEPGPRLLEALDAVCGGNPLLLREACALVPEGVVDRSEGGRELAEGAVLPLPPSAQILAHDRLQGLTPDDILLLQYASVGGQRFSSTALAAVSRRDELRILETLEGLARTHAVLVVRGHTRFKNGEEGTLFAFADAPLHAFLARQVTGRRKVELRSRLRDTRAKLGRALDSGEAEPEEGRALAPAAPAGDDLSPEHGGAPASSNPRRQILVGREEELERATTEVLQALGGGGGRVLFLQGPAGTGKSTLARAVLDRVAAERPGAAFARGRCLPSFESTEPYLPFVTALLDIVDEGTAGFLEQDRVSNLLAELAPYWLNAVPVVGSVLSASLATATALRGPTVEAAPSREALFAQYLDLVRGLATAAPLVLFLDDLHWADGSTLALLSHVARGLGDTPVAIVATLRPGEDGPDAPTNLAAELEQEGIGHSVRLGELAGGALDALLRAEFGGDVAEPLRRWVLSTAGGNPLFASELCRLLIQSGAAVEVRGEWQLTAEAERLDVPRSAEAVIERRIRSLPPSSVRVLQHASVAGSSFGEALLAGLLDWEPDALSAELDRLEREFQLILRAGQAELPGKGMTTVLEFRHALVHTVVYRGLARKRRILLHRRAGQILEGLHAGAEEGVAPRLARHFHEGGVGERAYRYGRIAAEAARAAFAHWEAEDLLRIALEHAEGPVPRSDVLEALADVYDIVGYYDRCLEALHAALEIVESAPPEGAALSPLRLQRKRLVVERKGGLVPTSSLLERNHRLLEEAEADDAERCRLLLELVRYPGAPGAMEAAEEALCIAESLEDTSLLAQALERLAVLLVFDGRPAEALPHLQRALDLVGRDDPVRGAFNRNVAGVARAKLGDYAGALEDFRTMLAMEERTGDLNGIGAAGVNLGAMLRRTGALDEAEEVLQRARTIHERRDRAGLLHSLLNLAERARWAGELDLAAQRFRELVSVAEELEYWTSEVVGWAGLGLCLLEADRLDQARAAQAAATTALAGRDEWFEDREYLDLLRARLEARDGRIQEAEERLAATAVHLEDVDRYAWAVVELERVRLLAGAAPDLARSVLEGVAAAIADSPSALDAVVDELRKHVAVPATSRERRGRKSLVVQEGLREDG